MIAAIIVAYNPEADSFVALLQSLSSQVDRLVVIDNSPPSNDSAFELVRKSGVVIERVNLLRLGDNLGIATALNLGIELAISEGANWLLLSDQDSLPAPDMAAGLMAAFAALQSRGLRVGAVGPTFTDLHTTLTYPFQANLPGQFFYGHRAPTESEPHVEALTLITSGTLIPAEAMREVGLMRDDFFIDQVDIEWCHRARSKGYRLYGTGWARMYQRMGEARLRVWYLRWRYESAYSPLRIYYRLRNFVALWKLDFVDWRWKLRSSWYCLGIVYSHVGFGTQRLASLRMAAKGVWHGLWGRMGRYRP
ncbi:MAG: glycosyltransferase family 2 protein [Halothiobacillaceae bacterium]|nr:glycosyltransferase family 2 protein [Halothiobacillaceae bacterium]